MTMLRQYPFEGDTPDIVGPDNPLAVRVIADATEPAPSGFNATPCVGTATYVIKSDPGFLKRLVFNKPVATGTVTLYDAGSAAGTPFAIITIPASPMPVTLDYDVRFSQGLTVVVGTAAQDLTVVWI